MNDITEIPIVDVADFIATADRATADRATADRATADRATADVVAGKIHDACIGTGFFYLTGHGVPQDLVDAAFEANRRFHALPMAKKLEIKQNRWHRGYQALASSTLKSSARFAAARHPNQLESFFLRHEVSPDDPSFERQPLQGPNQWPDDPGFVEVVRRYDAAITRLGGELLPAFSLAVGEEPGYFARHFAPASTALRLIHYPPAPAVAPGDLYGIHPHTDYGFLTILAQDRVGGLQIQRVDGSWIDAPYVPGSFILNIGDILARWTNDRFNSTPHRVINKSDRLDRYSIAMFFDPNLDSMIETLPRFADLQPGKYAPIRYGDYFAMRLDANYPDRVGVARAG